MIGRRFSLALLLAFGFCAVAAQGAVAQVGTQSHNTTAVTCVPEGGEEDFVGSHCDAYFGPGEGSWGHEAIPLDETAPISVENFGVPILNGTLAGVATDVRCLEAVSVAEKSFLHNVETSGKHTVTGTVQLNLSECIVVKPSKCTVKEPIVVTATFIGVEGLSAWKDSMGVEFVGEGAEKTFAELTFQNKGEEKCALAIGGKSFLVKGSAIATSNVAQGKEHSGATAVFEDANEMQTLEIGLKKASFSGTFYTRLYGGYSVSLTTVT